MELNLLLILLTGFVALVLAYAFLSGDSSNKKEEESKPSSSNSPSRSTKSPASKQPKSRKEKSFESGETKKVRILKKKKCNY